MNNSFLNRAAAGVVIIAAVITNGCSYTQTAEQVVPGSSVGGTGDVRYSHEPLGTNKHLLTVTAAPGLGETESSIAQRILIAATRFAAKTCSAAFEFVSDPNMDQTIAGGFMKRTKTYVFICKAS